MLRLKHETHSLYLKTITAIITFSFYLNTIAYSTTITRSSARQQEIAHINDIVTTHDPSPKHASKITIHPSLGSIREIYMPVQSKDTKASFPFIILVHDAHTHLEAQMNIKTILHHLTKNHNIHSIFLEGAIEDITPGYLHFFDKPELNQETAALLVKDGIIGGSELFLVDLIKENQTRKISFYGIENASLYQENLESFKFVLESRKKTNEFLNHIYSLILTKASQ